ncbi:MAG: alpha/beta hydrolase [Alphaproteobacteria bacterium]
MRAALAFAVIAAAASAAAAPAAADPTALPPDVQAKLAEVGPVWGTNILANVKKMEEAFTPLLAKAPRDGVTILRDQSYGPDPKQTLDVFKPAKAERAPVVVFVHGGAYVRGDKRVNDEIYGNVTLWFARQGALGINMTYRLAPAAAYPSGAEDVGAVVQWLKKNAAAQGGDPDRIFLIGHSAGATHVATYAFNKKVHPAEGPGVAGIVLMSGRYRLEIDTKDPNSRNMQAYFGSDPAQYADRSALSHIGGAKVPTFVVVAQYDNPGLDVSGGELFAALCKRDNACPRFTRMVMHNHLSMVHHFNTADESIGREILDFVAKRQ